MADTAKTDLWIDRDTGKVVKKQPERGTLLAREGGRVSAAAQVRLDALDADPAAEPVPAHEALGNPFEVATEPEAEQAADTVKSPAKKSSKSK